MNSFQKLIGKTPCKSLPQIVKNNNINTLPKSKKSCYDLIGPADKISNLRSYKYFIPENESKCEYEYRKLREEVQEFNHQYWTEQNLKFVENKKKFSEIKRMERQFLNKSNDSNEKLEITDPELNAKQMNEFYKEFLNDNYLNHYEYNKKWFSYNFSLLIPAVRVYLYRLKNRRIFEKR